MDSLPSKAPGKLKNTGVLDFPRDLSDPGIELGSLALHVDSLPAEPPGKPLSFFLLLLLLLLLLFKYLSLVLGIIVYKIKYFILGKEK